MTKKSNDIMSFTASELEGRRQRGESLTNWEKAALRPVPDGNNPDDAIDDVDWTTTDLPMPRPKVHASLRLDADMLDWFKSQGCGYQTKINAVLRSYFQQHVR